MFAVLVPPLAYVATAQSSMAAGVALVCLILLLTYRRRLAQIPPSSVPPAIALTLITHLLLANAFLLNPNIEKAFGSVALLMTMLAAAWCLSSGLRSISAPDITKSALLGFAIGFTSLFYNMEALGYNSYPKAVFPFPEPSHFAIAFAGIFLGAAAVASAVQRAAFVVVLIGLGVAMPNVTTLLCAGLLCCLAMRLPYLALLATLLVVAYKFGNLTGADYFLERSIQLSSTDNLSSLVFLQGWEEARNSLTRNFGIGAGLQNSISVEAGIFGERIFDILGRYKNREDAGFLAAKLIVELGFIGALLCLVYSVFFLRSFLILRRCYRHPRAYSPVVMLAHAVVVGFVLEMFVRGVGYFSPGTLLLLTAIFSLRKCVDEMPKGTHAQTGAVS